MSHPFTATQINSTFSVYAVSDLIAAAIGRVVYRDIDTGGALGSIWPWWRWPRERHWRKFDPHYEQGTHPWEPVYCAVQSEIEAAGQSANSMFALDPEWAWSGSLSAEANGRALLLAINNATEIEES